MEKTAVEFIIEEWKKKDFNQLDIFWLWRKAKEMEKEQIILSFEAGKCSGSLDNDEDYWGEEYYNETYTQSSE